MLLRAVLFLVVALAPASAFVPVSRSRVAVSSTRHGSFGAAGGSTRVQRREVARGLQMNQKKQIFSYVIAAGSALFIANVAESAINDQFNLWPELKKVDSWNYSGSNDAICAKMEVEVRRPGWLECTVASPAHHPPATPCSIVRLRLIVRPCVRLASSACTLAHLVH